MRPKLEPRITDISAMIKPSQHQQQMAKSELITEFINDESKFNEFIITIANTDAYDYKNIINYLLFEQNPLSPLRNFTRKDYNRGDYIHALEGIENNQLLFKVIQNINIITQITNHFTKNSEILPLDEFYGDYDLIELTILLLSPLTTVIKFRNNNTRNYCKSIIKYNENHYLKLRAKTYSKYGGGSTLNNLLSSIHDEYYEGMSDKTYDNRPLKNLPNGYCQNYINTSIVSEEIVKIFKISLITKIDSLLYLLFEVMEKKEFDYFVTNIFKSFDDSQLLDLYLFIYYEDYIGEDGKITMPLEWVLELKRESTIEKNTLEEEMRKSLNQMVMLLNKQESSYSNILGGETFTYDPSYNLFLEL